MPTILGRPARRARVFCALLLAGFTMGVFLPLTGNGFISYDDPMYVTENRHVLAGLSGAGVRWSLTATEGGNWHPATWWSHMLDATLYGARPSGHHLTSVLIHASSAAGLFLLLCEMTGATGASLLVAGLFALHPLHVESVAWVAERKDVLAAFFWIATLAAYLSWVRRPRRTAYFAALGLFALALMAKPMAVTLPLVLLILDVWPLGRLRPGRPAVVRILAEKIPFLLPAAAVGVVTLSAQLGAKAFEPMADAPLPFMATLLGTRVLNALYSSAWYLAKVVWPSGLAIFYPYPAHSLSLWQTGGAFLLVAVISLAAVRRRRVAPWLAAGWLWYLVTLAPIAGLIQVGAQARADRYTYIPLIGVFLAAGWTARELVGRRSSLRGTAPALGALLLAACTVVTLRQEGFWLDSTTLFRHAAEVTRNNFLAHRVLGDEARRRGAFTEAEAEYRATLALVPRSPGGHNRLGLALSAQGKHEEAVARYREAVRLSPGYAEAHSNLGVDLTALGRLPEAEEHLRIAARLKPDSAEIHSNLGDVLAAEGRFDEAAGAYARALELKPDFARARTRLERARKAGGVKPG